MKRQISNLATKNRWILSASSISVMLALSSHSFAADTALDQDNVKQEESFEVITVTATKREKSQQDIAASISTYSTSDIETLGIDDLEGIARSMPGVTLNQPIKNRSAFNIRGIATSTSGGNTQDPVSVYINDMPVTDTFGASVQPDLRLYDVERVEVLRGPQGTLFGSGSLGGTIRVITRKAELDEFESSARIDFANTKDAGLRQRYDGMINFPVVEETLAVRAVGYYRDEAGWVENIALDTDNSVVEKGGRVSARWQAADNLDATFEVLYQSSKPEDSDAWAPDLGKFKKSSAQSEGRPSTLTSYNATINYNVMDFATLVSSTSYTSSETAVRIDYGDITGLGFPLLANNEPWEVEFVSQELRLVSNAESKLEWIGGLFYINRESNADFQFTLPGFADYINTNVAAGLMEDDIFLKTNTKTESEELAAFGELSYQFTDEWVGTIGARVSNVKVSIKEPERQVLNFATFAKESVEFFNQGEDNGTTTWRASLSYQPSDNWHLYSSVATGYRIGQTNPFVGKSPVDPDDPLDIPNLYGPDKTLNYEFGVKSFLFDRQVRLNAALFYIEWSDIQIDAIRLSDVANYIANAGEAVSQGAELELELRVVDDLKLNLAVTLQDSEITEINSADSIRSGVVKGDSLPGAVDYQVAVSAQYDWDVYSKYEMFAYVGAQFVGDSLNGFSNQAGATTANPYLAENDAYENVEASVGIFVDEWEINVYAENLTNNDDFILNSGDLSSSYINTLRPRTVGLRLHYRFY
ncbi:TonB-dependent receptor [Psychrosphaera sp. B3R10]|uniref:TonB-dependent receptor n=1 Tax=unclassified Psychrosphaera TaxID=2641570 RepID=UPI001C081C12|nr:MULTISPECIES: TonB-dependent receptor [unclassified Psychrosphaera]MBU2881859.1 TonB-dependent receptor [Psychrosphaera sp. I2R16]MBU2989880.1 TonB-dependent receptor [Psychrosphaera sp. B3R10]